MLREIFSVKLQRSRLDFCHFTVFIRVHQRFERQDQTYITENERKIGKLTVWKQNDDPITKLKKRLP